MEEQLSLCVSEYDDNNTLLWRRIGDYIGANRVLYPVQRGSQPELLSTDFVSGHLQTVRLPPRLRLLSSLSMKSSLRKSLRMSFLRTRRP